jgi:hypothetical protein
MHGQDVDSHDQERSNDSDEADQLPPAHRETGLHPPREWNLEASASIRLSSKPGLVGRHTPASETCPPGSVRPASPSLLRNDIGG